MVSYKITNNSGNNLHYIIYAAQKQATELSTGSSPCLNSDYLGLVSSSTPFYPYWTGKVTPTADCGDVKVTMGKAGIFNKYIVTDTTGKPAKMGPPGIVPYLATRVPQVSYFPVLYAKILEVGSTLKEIGNFKFTPSTTWDTIWTYNIPTGQQGMILAVSLDNCVWYGKLLPPNEVHSRVSLDSLISVEQVIPGYSNFLNCGETDCSKCKTDCSKCKTDCSKCETDCSKCAVGGGNGGCPSKKISTWEIIIIIFGSIFGLVLIALFIGWLVIRGKKNKLSSSRRIK